MLSSEFFAIGVDYKDNVNKARVNHPHITFNEVNMDSGKRFSLTRLGEVLLRGLQSIKDHFCGFLPD